MIKNFYVKLRQVKADRGRQAFSNSQASMDSRMYHPVPSPSRKLEMGNSQNTVLDTIDNLSLKIPGDTSSIIKSPLITSLQMKEQSLMDPYGTNYKALKLETRNSFN